MKMLICSSLMLIGASFMFIAALGVLRFPDIYSRMQAATKTSTTGLGLMIVACGIHFEYYFTSLTTLIFIFVTSPVGAHLLAKTAHSRKEKAYHNIDADELLKYKDQEASQ